MAVYAVTLRTKRNESNFGRQISAQINFDDQILRLVHELKIAPDPL